MSASAFEVSKSRGGFEPGTPRLSDARPNALGRLACLCAMASVLFAGPAAAAVRYAKPASSGAGTCLSWTNACTLQTALTGAVSGDEFWVLAGAHEPTATTDRVATFLLRNGAGVCGGLAGFETLRTQRNWLANVTVLSGDIDSNDGHTPVITDFLTATGNTTNSYHVVTGATGATLDGFPSPRGTPTGRGPGRTSSSESWTSRRSRPSTGPASPPSRSCSHWREPLPIGVRRAPGSGFSRGARPALLCDPHAHTQDVPPDHSRHRDDGLPADRCSRPEGPRPALRPLPGQPRRFLEHLPPDSGHGPGELARRSAGPEPPVRSAPHERFVDSARA